MKSRRSKLTWTLILAACAAALFFTHVTSVIAGDRPNMTISTTLHDIALADGGGVLIAHNEGIYGDFSPGLVERLGALGLGANVDAIHQRSNETWLFSTATTAVWGGMIIQQNLMYGTDGTDIWPFQPYNRKCGTRFATLDAYTMVNQNPRLSFISVSQLQIVPGYGIAHPGDILLCDGATGRVRLEKPLSRRGVDNIDGLCDPRDARQFLFSSKLDMVSFPPFILFDQAAYGLGFVQRYNGATSMVDTVDGLSCERRLLPPPRPCDSAGGCAD
ncbi:MAG: hypothetical protein GY716_20610 [bacterium]|nr:hypothetical protein [bacterium]